MPLQQLDVARPIEAPAAAALHGLELRELGLPEAQHVLLDAELHRHLADVAKCFHCLCQGSAPAERCERSRPGYSAALRRIRPGVDALLHDVARPEHQHATRRDRNFLARLGIAPDPLRPSGGCRTSRTRRASPVSPAARLVEISCKMSSTSSWNSLRGSPTFWTTASARSARVSVLPPMVFRPSPAPYCRRC